ncbi:LysR family transcriptional regulator [Guptibacillus algicola]|uniref:LysR family transcriptional regulator n=1 Tax=Guptibacillus algicola TaxID=225844 RepID=UPI001CD2ABB6|nr:LysR family transcriptional regulator [Alkalihalobacillus algicola]MCA0985680.1 LysR family transcriptional regulator [Alkalihalobacillus algicola]
MLGLLETFVSVVECGSLSAAAKKMHANQPNLSVRIQKLEEMLDVKLFDREGKKLILNPVGKKLYEQTKPVLKMVETIQEEMSLYKHPETGHIRIGGGYQILLTTLLPFMDWFTNKYPQVTYEMNEVGPASLIHHLIDQYELDIGLVDTSFTNEQIESIPLGIDSTIKLIVPNSNHYHNQNSISQEELKDLSFIVFKKETKLRNEIDEALRERDISLSILMETNHIDLMIKMVEMGLGVSFLPISTDSHIVIDKRVKVLHVEGLEFQPKLLYLIYRKNRYYPSSMLQFITELKSFYYRR